MTSVVNELASFPIVDADTHILEPADIWSSRLPSKYADVMPRVELYPESGHHHWRIGEHWLSPVGQAAQAGWKEYPPSFPWEFEECDSGTYDSTDRLARMDQYGIDVQLLYPNIIGFHAAHIIELGSEVAELCVTAYNDFSIEWSSVDPRRLIPMAMLPFWDLDASVKEMKRCAELGFKGILFANKFEQIGLPRFVDPYWDPIYAAAQEMGLPINFHVGFGNWEGHLSAENMRQWREMAGEARLAAVLRGTQAPMRQSEVLGDLLVSGLCERFPRLKLVSVETGFGHLPFYLEALDWQWKAWGNRSLPLLPSEYFTRQCFCTFWFDRVSLPLLAAYPDNFMFSTDYPHPTSLSPGPCGGTELMPSDWVAEAFSAIDPALAAKALYGNAAKIYGLDL